jgi:hypothetical protein
MGAAGVPRAGRVKPPEERRCPRCFSFSRCSGHSWYSASACSPGSPSLRSVDRPAAIGHPRCKLAEFRWTIPDVRLCWIPLARRVYLAHLEWNQGRHANVHVVSDPGTGRSALRFRHPSVLGHHCSFAGRIWRRIRQYPAPFYCAPYRPPLTNCGHLRAAARHSGARAPITIATTRRKLIRHVRTQPRSAPSRYIVWLR